MLNKKVKKVTDTYNSLTIYNAYPTKLYFGLMIIARKHVDTENSVTHAQLRRDLSFETQMWQTSPAV